MLEFRWKQTPALHAQPILLKAHISRLLAQKLSSEDADQGTNQFPGKRGSNIFFLDSRSILDWFFDEAAAVPAAGETASPLTHESYVDILSSRSG